MSHKNCSHGCCEDDIIESDEEDMEVKVENAIKELPTLEEKVQAIAINQYLIQKRALDKEVLAEINKIEVTYRKTFQPLLDEIFNIVSGNVDLTDADLEGVDHLLTDLEKETKANYYPKKPIEDYWQKALISHDSIAEAITPEDEKAILHLTKIQTYKSEDGKNFTLTFHFSENQFFTNSTIKKEFELEADEIKRSFGTSIEWKEGKNLTMEIVKKKNKKKKTTTTKQVKKDSFFNIFSEVDLTSDNEEEEKEEDEAETDAQVEELEKQYEICNALYEDVVPKSLEYYLGVTPGFGDEDFMKGIADQDGDDDDDDEEQEEKPKKKKNKKRKGSQSSKE